jgi:hypothetical protein
MKITELFLTENINKKTEEIFNIIKKHIKEGSIDKDLLEFLVKKDNVLYRGIKYPKPGFYYYGEPRKDRKPVDTPVVFDILINDVMEKNGIEARRNNSFFVTTSLETADKYGSVHSVIPINDFYFYINKNIKDMYVEIKYKILENIVIEHDINDYTNILISDDTILKIFESRIIDKIKNFIKLIDFIILDKKNDPVVEKVKNIYEKTKDKEKASIEIIKEILSEFLNKKYSDREELLNIAKDFINLIRKNRREIHNLSSNVLFQNDYFKDTFRNYSEIMISDIVHYILDNIKNIDFTTNTKELENIIKYFREKGTDKKIEKIILDGAIYGQYSKNKNAFISGVSSSGGNEILIRGKCLFVDYRVFKETRLPFRLKGIFHDSSIRD